MDMPFPGMDPYLEHPVLWTSVHSRLIHWLDYQLGALVRPRYVTSIEERIYIGEAEQQRIPDLWVQKTRSGAGGTAVAELESAAPLVLEVEELEIHEHYIEVRDRFRAMQVVTIIELVSPSNKAPGPGRTSYLAKQQAVLASEAHLVEVDLLRRGSSVMSVSEARVRAKTDYDYLACVNRWPRRKRFELYPWRLRDPMPPVWVPLAAPDRDVPLDLRAALERVYESGGYMLRIPYEQPCDPPLAPADQQWASACWAAYRAAHPDLFPQGNS